MSIRCPYCEKKLGGIKSVYGHWAWCGKYHDFIKEHGREARLSFRWIGYRDRSPKRWIEQKAPDKPVGKPGD